LNPEELPPSRLRILHLEDNLLDAELTQSALSSEWPACHILRVENESEFVGALGKEEFDVILSDFSLPSFNGLAALDLAKKLKPGIPYIFLSGTIGEENAVKALRNGATDYVIKDRPGRLVPAVRRALRDVEALSEKKKLEAQFLRAQRLESVGVLAGGIAHDLNNVLAPILMAVDLIQHKTQDQEILRLMGVLETSVQHGAALLRQVLAFARGVDGERTSMELESVFSDVVSLLGDTLPKAIKLQNHIAPGTAPILSNPTQLGQVLMNLCVNARDAMPDGGLLTLSAGNVILDASKVPEKSGARGGAFVQISVADTGTGMPPEILGRIFDPFFSTKGVGSGTGLGLSTVLGIVRSHGGFMDVESRVGSGTEFRLYFPSAEAAPRAAVHSREPEVRSGAGRSILVIDDEEGIRVAAEGLLEVYGYRPIVSADGSAALVAFHTGAELIDAVVVDLMLPGMQGPEIVRRLRQIKPDVRIVAMSGIEGDQGGLKDEPGRLVLLKKPMSGPELLRAIERVLPPR
jgi:two-component system cell cycle sensor histidine kinase/response regulator CckA